MDREPTRVAGLQRSIGGPSDVRAVRALTRRLVELQPDIVHTHLSKAGTLGRLAARGAGVKGIVHTFHGHFLDSYFARPVAWSFLQVERWLAPRSSALIGVSENVKQELLSRGVGTPRQWHVIPTVTRSLHGPLIGRQDARVRFRLPHTSTVFGFFGRLEPVKNCQLFLEAGEIVASKSADVRMLVVGERSERDALRAWSEVHLPGRVEFTGWEHEPLWAMSACDVVVSSSRNEGLGLSLMEAGAIGVPVVATNVGGVGDVVKDGVNGLLTPADDPEALAAAVLRLLGDAALVRDLTIRGSQMVKERFDVGVSVDRLLAVYEDCL